MNCAGHRRNTQVRCISKSWKYWHACAWCLFYRPPSPLSLCLALILKHTYIWRNDRFADLLRMRKLLEKLELSEFIQEIDPHTYAQEDTINQSIFPHNCPFSIYELYLRLHILCVCMCVCVCVCVWEREWEWASIWSLTWCTEKNLIMKKVLANS